MRAVLFFSITALLALSACGSSNDSSGESNDPKTSDNGFDPPPPKDGYTRIEAATIRDIQPGADVSYCQYVMRGLDHDVDVLDVGGYQSKFGHHAVAFTFADTGEQVLGDAFPCMGTEVTSGDPTQVTGDNLGAFLGGPAGADDIGAKLLPDGVAFRVKQGNGIMVNLHYINTGTEPIDGDAVVDVQMVDVDPNRKIAALSINLNMQFSLDASAPGSTTSGCTAQEDVSYIMFANHMHEYGASAVTEVVRTDGSVEVLHEDPSWAYDMQFNLVFSRWTVEAPFVLHAGDQIRTTCNWDNTTSGAIKFPREMCIGLGFALTDGTNPKAPSCMDGTWMHEFL